MRLFYIIAVICLLGACGGKQTKENTNHSALENDKEISLIANPLAIDTASSISKVVEDTFEFSPQAEVALYSNKFNSRTECDYWIVDLALEKRLRFDCKRTLWSFRFNIVCLYSAI